MLHEIMQFTVGMIVRMIPRRLANAALSKNAFDRKPVRIKGVDAGMHFRFLPPGAVCQGKEFLRKRFIQGYFEGNLCTPLRLALEGDTQFDSVEFRFYRLDVIPILRNPHITVRPVDRDLDASGPSIESCRTVMVIEVSQQDPILFGEPVHQGFSELLIVVLIAKRFLQVLRGFDGKLPHQLPVAGNQGLCAHPRADFFRSGYSYPSLVNGVCKC